jgi:hypothetical protein
MSTSKGRAEGTIEVKTYEPTPYDTPAEGPTLNEIRVTETFKGARRLFGEDPPMLQSEGRLMMLAAIVAGTLGAAGCHRSYHDDLVAICACPYEVPAGASSATASAAGLAVGKCMDENAKTPHAKKLVGAIGGSSTAPVRGKIVREAAKGEGVDSCPLADAFDKVWAAQQAK